MNKEETKYLSEANQLIQTAEHHHELKEVIASILMLNDELQQENKQLQTSANNCKQRIDKAINELDKLNIKLKEILSIGIDIKEISDIEKILKGNSNE